MSTKMTVAEMIKKFGLEIITRDGQEGLSVTKKKPTTKELEELKASKSETIAEIKRRKSEREELIKAMDDKREAEKDELIASGKAVKAIVYSGSYLLDKELAWVSKMTKEEETGYADWCQGMMYKYVSTITKVEDIRPDRAGDGRLNQESNIWVLSEKELQRIERKILETEIKDQKKIEEKIKQDAEEKETIEDKFAQSKATGEKVLLSQWSEPCNDPKEECSVDYVYNYAMPDGSTLKVRSHTW